MINYIHKVRPDDPNKLEYLVSDKIKLGDSLIHGRGVFASKNIKKGEIIERCPLIQMQNRSKYQLDRIVFDYMYAQPPCDCFECKNHGFIFYMALGYGMLYNHQDDPNALWKFNYTQLLGDVICVKDIKQDEEIFVNYGNAYFTNEDRNTGKDQKKLQDRN